MAQRFTDKFIAALSPASDRYEKWEGGGFGIRVSPRGAKAWVWVYHYQGRPRRMTFKDRHALEMLPARIAALQAELARLNEVLSDPGLYARDPRRFAKLTETLGAAQDGLTAAEEQWLTLAILREEIEGTPSG